jgi:hypothetical protein
MYAGLGDVWSDLAAQLGGAATSAASVLARLRDGRASTVGMAIAQASAAGEISPQAAAAVQAAAGVVANQAQQVQTVAGSIGGVSQLGQFAKSLPAWALPVGIGALLFLMFRR